MFLKQPLTNNFKRLIFISFLDCFLQELNVEFTIIASHTVLAFYIITVHVEHLTIQIINSIYGRFGTDVDSTKTSFEQEGTVLKHIGLEVKIGLPPSQKHYTIIMHANVFKSNKSFAAFSTVVNIHSFC